MIPRSPELRRSLAATGLLFLLVFFSVANATFRVTAKMTLEGEVQRVVTAPYRVDADHIGVLGVIGPTRMAYDRVVPIVDITARLLASAMNPQK